MKKLLILVGAVSLCLLGCPQPFQDSPQGYSGDNSIVDPSTPQISAKPVFIYSASSGNGTITPETPANTIGDTTVNISSSAAGAAIYYTRDGNPPNPSSGSSTSKYSDSSPIVLAVSNPPQGTPTQFTLKAISIEPNKKPSPVVAVTVNVTYIVGPGDSTPPAIANVSIASNNLNNTAYAREGDTVTLTFLADDPETGVPIPPNVTIAGSPAGVAQVGSLCTATHVMTGSAFSDQVVPFTIHAVNGAGLASDVSLGGGSVTYYFGSPAMSSVTMGSDNPNSGWATVGNTVKLYMSSNRAITAAPWVMFASVATGAVLDSGLYVATHTMGSTEPEGQITFSISFQDAAGNAGTATGVTSGSPVKFDRTIPAPCSVTVPGSGYVNAADQTAMSFNVSDTEVGTTLYYTITDPQGMQVNGNVPVTTTAFVVSPVDVHTLGEGTLTIGVALQDPAGNVSTVSTAPPITKDTVPPAGYSVTFSSLYVNTTNEASMGFTFAYAELNSNYDYIVQTVPPAEVTGGGTATSSTAQVSGIDVSGLPDGPVHLYFRQTDKAGNSGPYTAASMIMKDTTPPSVTSIAMGAGNTTVVVLFSEGVYGSPTLLVPIASASMHFTDDTAGVSAFVSTVDHSAGATVATFVLGWTQPPASGNKIMAYIDGNVFDQYGNAMPSGYTGVYTGAQ